MAKENAYVGRYGDTLRRLTALDRQNAAFGAPQAVGGADMGGFGPSLTVQPKLDMASGFSQDPAPQMGSAQPAPAAPAQTSPQVAGAFSAPETPQVLKDTPGIAGPIQTGGDKPTSFSDLMANASEEEQDQLVAEVEKQGKGKMDGFLEKVRKVLGTQDVPKMSRRETAQYVAEIALRAMSKRNDPAYAQNPSGVFADAVLEASAGRKAAAEKTRLEGREDTETRRKEAREDSMHTRSRSEQAQDHARDRSEKIEDDKRSHEQALELARIQAKLLRDRNQRTSIQVQEDGSLVLVNEDGTAVDVTKEVEETTPTKGSRGQGTTGGEKRKTRKPVKVKPKYNAGGLDQDTLVNRTSDAEKALRGNRKLMRELGSKFANDQTKIEAEIRRMAREKVEGDVQSLGAGQNEAGVIDFNDL